MGSSREESRSLLGDRNQNQLGISVTSTTTSTPIYVGGTLSRELMIRLPHLQKAQPSLSTDHSLHGGDMPVVRTSLQTSISCGNFNTRNCPTSRFEIPYQRPVNEHNASNDSSCIFGTGIRQEAMVKLNVDTLPSVSTAARCSVNKNLSSLYGTQNSFGNHGYSGNTCRDEFRGTPSMKGVKPGTYDGTESWSDYLFQFNLIAEYCHWRGYEKSLQLAIHLRGTAQGVLADLRQEQRMNFTSLTSALAAKFEPVQQSELHCVKLKTRVRREGETLPELAQDANKLIRLAYPSTSADIREQLSKDCFIDALNDPDLEWAVLQGKPKQLKMRWNSR